MYKEVPPGEVSKGPIWLGDLSDFPPGELFGDLSDSGTYLKKVYRSEKFPWGKFKKVYRSELRDLSEFGDLSDIPWGNFWGLSEFSL